MSYLTGSTASSPKSAASWPPPVCRASAGGGHRKAVLEEMADVLLCINVLADLHGDMPDVQAVNHQKRERLVSRLTAFIGGTYEGERQP